MAATRAILFGNIGNDVLIGGGGSDQFSAGLGNDTIDGGTGNDAMSGGLGDDSFVFRLGDGVDHVMDFTAGDSSGDLIELTGYGVATFCAAPGRHDPGWQQRDDRFDSDNQITLHDVTLGQLNQNDFLLA